MSTGNEERREHPKKATLPFSSDDMSTRAPGALESAKQGVWDMDLLAGTRSHSPYWFTMRGLDSSNATAAEADAWMERVHPDDRNIAAKGAETSGDNRYQILQCEYRERHADGHYIWIQRRGQVILDVANGRAVRALGTDTDITSMKKLSDAERRWRVALESTGQGLWDIRPQTGETYHSRNWFKMRGMKVDAKVSASLEEYLLNVHPEDHVAILDNIRRQDAQLTDEVNHKYRLRHADGHWVWIHSKGRVVSRDSKGMPTRIVGTDTDITALKHSEAEILKLTRRYSAAVSASKIGVWEYDLQQLRPYWDENMRELFGVPADQLELAADRWENTIHPEDREKAMRIAEDAIARKGKYAMDYRILLPDGVTKHVHCRAQYHEDAHGEKLVGATWDISDDYEVAGQLEAARKKLEYSSLHDALTGLPNRRMLDVRMEELAALEGRESRCVILHLDLDRFKQINDTLGHAAGDKVLCHSASTMRELMPSDALISRVGGDEFVIVLHDNGDDAELSRLVELLIARMRMPIEHEGQDCMCGASIGIATAGPGECFDKKLLIKADIALYRAKAAGRNSFAFHTEEMEAATLAHKKCADDILRGLKRGEFFPLYQLQYSARTLEVTGVEALARWRHPERGVLSPAEFLPVAEDINALASIDEQILVQALKDFRQWDAQGIRIPRVAVNVSARRLSDGRLIERLKVMDIPPGTFSFELLESIYLDRQDDVIASNIQAIRDMGIAIELDDFGTGHASIAGLVSLRPNRFKIDRGLVAPILESVTQRQLVRSIIDIGKALGIEVVAEGVETLDHARVLDTLDCDYLQGFAFGKPMNATDLVALVSTQQARQVA
jgi:diguanylate cyclase (GGDEF)-like protein/PAS domain S-box-containing protein